MGALDGKVAIVTGAARGQGEAQARLFAVEGAKVLLGDVLDDEGTEVAASIGEAAAYRHMDVTQESQWQEAMADVEGRWGRVDVLVNNAGIARFAPLVMTPLEDYMAVIGVNQVGVFLGMKTVVPLMARTGGGSIVNTSSVDGMTGMVGVSAYVASKFAVRGMTKTAALELGSAGIRVNSIHPGGVDTPMLHPEGMPAIDLSSVFTKVPLQRIGTVDDVAELALFLASERSAYCTGSEFVIDGGLLAGFGMGSFGALG
ncbi:MAG: glucose 1-dehydrogenase [Acidimicrobiales bacterium]|nr:glucose 1-dehydrogenase [Acidimicrobiales bacterium]